MKLQLDEGLNLSPRIQNFLEENGIFTYSDLLYWTMKSTGEDSIEFALDEPVKVPPRIKSFLQEHDIVTLRDLLSRPGVGES
jgi:hypothetical protein